MIPLKLLFVLVWYNQAQQANVYEGSNLGDLVATCEKLVAAYHSGELGICDLPEDIAPNFADDHAAQLTYFTLPMALNYRRNSTQLWKATFATYEDSETRDIFSIPFSAQLSLEETREYLLKYKVAMQPTRHTLSWHVISQTIYQNWGSIENMLASVDYDYLKLKELVQKTYRKGFPYLAGPKLFNYWCFILGEKCGIELKHKEYIDIAVDSHVLRCSIKLGVIGESQADKLSREQIAAIWRERLTDSSVAPTDLNVPLWFWSRNGFVFEP